MLRAIVFNNMSCMCRRKGLLTNALKYGQKALILETQCVEVENPVATHLNLAAIQSQLGRFEFLFFSAPLSEMKAQTGTGTCRMCNEGV